MVDATLPHLPPVVADMVRFERLTGCRPGEVSAIRPCDVERAGEVWQYWPESHKTEHHGRQRIIWIGPKAQEVLLPYLLRDAQAHCFQPAESEQKRREEMHARRKTPVQPSQWNRRKAKPARQPKTTYDRNSYAKANITEVYAEKSSALCGDCKENRVAYPILLIYGKILEGGLPCYSDGTSGT